MGRKAVTTVRDQIPIFAVRPNEGESIPLRQPIPVEFKSEHDRGEIGTEAGAAHLHVRPLLGLMESSRYVETLAEIGERAAQRDIRYERRGRAA